MDRIGSEAVPRTSSIGAVVPVHRRRPDERPEDEAKQGGGGGRERRGEGGGEGDDCALLHPAEQVTRQLLHERVLAHTRTEFAVDRDAAQRRAAFAVHEFAENVDGETLDSFVGRLIGAQNQLASAAAAQSSAGALDPATRRQRLDRAFFAGLAEAESLLGQVHGRQQQGEHVRAALALIARIAACYAEVLAHSGGRA